MFLNKYRISPKFNVLFFPKLTDDGFSSKSLIKGEIVKIKKFGETHHSSPRLTPPVAMARRLIGYCNRICRSNTLKVVSTNVKE